MLLANLMALIAYHIFAIMTASPAKPTFVFPRFKSGWAGYLARADQEAVAFEGAESRNDCERVAKNPSKSRSM
ncbi:hypothetical protein GCM10007874_31250 [Labrys miyagiensis]|uniref:Uncharacterized protein n=1 Tax=Labrys miyagiensis TaxID=346912 RepID=A0ABQ6CK63_9HYPH|nr:hypothetical protein [Labrys miyagiensis]GLS20108.1 hypothetical protein GCM10007874_31250 [Labrys miyagiensis]